MKIFAIIDEETTLLTGILLYYEKEGTCVIIICSLMTK